MPVDATTGGQVAGGSRRAGPARRVASGGVELEVAVDGGTVGGSHLPPHHADTSTFQLTLDKAPA
jgi:hypothetical protein